MKKRTKIITASVSAALICGVSVFSAALFTSATSVSKEERDRIELQELQKKTNAPDELKHGKYYYGGDKSSDFWIEVSDNYTIEYKSSDMMKATENDFASEDEVVNYILRERQVELAGEGRRWFDLLRTGKWKEVMKPINGMEQDGNELFPIHYSHILENPKIVQNTYYGNTNN